MITSFIPIPKYHPCFPDHFPGQPIVPGALLLQWILSRVRSEFTEFSIIEIRSMKFLIGVRPDDRCRLELAVDPSSRYVDIDCYSESGLVCKGVLELAAKAPLSRG